MSNEEGRKFSIERIILISVSVLLIVAVAFIAITALKKDKPTSGTLPGAATPVPVEEAPGLLPTEVEPEQPPVEAEVTPTPRRLELLPTPTAFQVASEDDVRAILDLANPDHVDYFDIDNWYDYDTEGSAAYRVEDGHLFGKDYEPEEKYVYWTYTNVQSGNVYAEISATNGDCIGKDSVGLNIRFQQDRSPSGYALEVACDGSWRFRRHRFSKSPEELIGWTPSEFINTGLDATNRLGIWGYMGKFILFINGYQVGEYFDSDYIDTFGYFTLYVRASQTYDLTATFDDFAFWHIPFIP